MKPLWTTIFFMIVSLAACSNMTGLWQLDWQSMSTSGCAPNFFTIREDDQGNFTAVFNYTQGTINTYCARNFTGNFNSNLTYNTSTSAWMDSTNITNIQLSYDNSTDTIRYLYPNPTLQLLYDRNGSYIPQNISIPFIGAVWTNITVTNSTGGNCSCIPSSILITPSATQTGELYIQPTFSAPNCSTFNFTSGFILNPDLQSIQWTAAGNIFNTINLYIFDPYNPNQLTVQTMNGTISESTKICEYSAQKFTDFTPLSGTWYLDWQSTNFDYVAPHYIEATPEDDDAYISTYLQSPYTLDGTGYLIGGFNNQYFDSNKNLGFTYDEPTNTLLSFPTPLSPFSILFSPNGSLINNTFVASYWGSPLLTNGSSVPTTCCIPSTIYLMPGSQTQIMTAEYYFDQDYKSNPACQSIAQVVKSTPYYVSLQIGTPDISKLLWIDGYGSTISFANATTKSKITVQDFMNQTQCSFNMVITSNPNSTPQNPLSGNLMVREIAYLVIGLFMMLNLV